MTDSRTREETAMTSSLARRLLGLGDGVFLIEKYVHTMYENEKEDGLGFGSLVGNPQGGQSGVNAFRIDRGNLSGYMINGDGVCTVELPL